ncbi:hypothetical protein Bbelb_005930 [Branchiostoma belcheri]|nr:hypothetical protein Bbelb_005930 [Branchiostoma belcheri]
MSSNNLPPLQILRDSKLAPLQQAVPISNPTTFYRDAPECNCSGALTLSFSGEPSLGLKGHGGRFNQILLGQQGAELPFGIDPASTARNGEQTSTAPSVSRTLLCKTWQLQRAPSSESLDPDQSKNGYDCPSPASIQSRLDKCHHGGGIKSACHTSSISPNDPNKSGPGDPCRAPGVDVRWRRWQKQRSSDARSMKWCFQMPSVDIEEFPSIRLHQ